MARRRTTSFGRTRQVVVIGHNSQVQSTVALFVGGKVTVRVYTADPSLEDRLALYPGVQVTLVEPGYHHPPPDLPDSAFFLCVDKEDVAKRIRDWLPATLAVFHLATERRGKNAAPGFLAFTAPQSQIRKRLLNRLATIRRVDRLLGMARGARYPVILMYGDPDPDAIGSAMALSAIWRQAGAEPVIRYTGEIQRYQNRLLVSYLKEPMDRLRDHELESSDLVAIVDAQPDFWKHAQPQAHVVIDHHPIRPETQGQYLDLRENYGSTVTILLEYLQAASIPIKKRLATAMLYGLVTDTGDLRRNVHSADIKAYDELFHRADQNFLSRLSKSQVPEGMLDHIAWGISRRIAYRDMMLIHFGEIGTPDILVQAADLLLLTCGINWVVCAGKHGDTLVVVFRGDGHRQDVGSRAKVAFAKLGSAGGHRTMGRAEIPLHGEHVDATVDILVDNLFKRMKASRQQEFVRIMRNHLHGQGPASPEPIGGTA